VLDFRTPCMDDRELIESFVKESGQSGCDITFVNTYLWREHYDIQVAFDSDTYYKCYLTDGEISGYTLPITRGSLKRAVDNVIADAHERGVRPLIGLLNDNAVSALNELYGDKVSIEPSRESFDYIYDREALATLSGKKYHAKRNHISRFLRNHPDNSFAEISPDNYDDVMDIVRRWILAGEDTGEEKIIRDALEHFEELGLFGLLLYVDGRAVAMTIGSRINDDICDVNFEKAVDIDEAYAVINNAFAKRYADFKYINREEDIGLEGLRKSKLSYHPQILYSKSTALFDL